ncbi:hypothetical protein CAPI_08295 [Corynebacterium capitovis DSM 44611]|uniref:hypothetical protein n=1 Tax=Corynebacterium capitovis TaxID=131081 RepID=UPI00036B4874|nr:hypothetical protein [Corynebacterium capitovis]WKD58186.1 hypothetical protein CAPI_08295 [Corynebacterium capitovis DSM 44611]
MDIATIKLHLDNFVNTWEGWGNILKGLNELIYPGYFRDFVGLSSKIDDTGVKLINTSSQNLSSLSSVTK